MESPIIKQVKNDLDKRDAQGYLTWGKALEGDEYSFDEWIQEAYEEILDFLIYMRGAINRAKGGKTSKL